MLFKIEKSEVYGVALASVYLCVCVSITSSILWRGFITTPLRLSLRMIEL